MGTAGRRDEGAICDARAASGSRTMAGWTSLLTGKPFDQHAMSWEQPKQIVARWQIKVREVEAWRNRATAERVSRAQRRGCLKHTRRHHRLRNIAAGQVGAQSDRASGVGVK